MSKTLRKDRNGKTFKESLKKRNSRYKCRCEYCSGVALNKTKEKIADKELEQQIKTDEYNFRKDGTYVEDHETDL